MQYQVTVGTVVVVVVGAGVVVVVVVVGAGVVGAGVVVVVVVVGAAVVVVVVVTGDTKLPINASRLSIKKDLQ